MAFKVKARTTEVMTTLGEAQKEKKMTTFHFRDHLGTCYLKKIGVLKSFLFAKIVENREIVVLIT